MTENATTYHDLLTEVLLAEISRTRDEVALWRGECRQLQFDAQNADTQFDALREERDELKAQLQYLIMDRDAIAKDRDAIMRTNKALNQELRKAHNAPAGTTPASLPLWQDVQRLLLHAGIATIRRNGDDSWQVSDGSSTQHTAATLADAVWSFQAAAGARAQAWEHEE